MNEKYDAIICGTTVKDSMLGRLLQMKGMRVLHIDMNGINHSKTQSLGLDSLYQLFRPGQQPPKEYSSPKAWNIDLVPKLLMAHGKAAKLLLHTKASEYISWICLGGSYVYQFNKGGYFTSDSFSIYKVPGNSTEALLSTQMSFFEKRRCGRFLEFVENYNSKDSSTTEGFDAIKETATALFNKFGLEENTIDFIGHAVALFSDDEYLKLPALNLITRAQLYSNSAGLYGDSPFLYPVCGSSLTSNALLSLTLSNGGKLLLHKSVDEILFDHGIAIGVRSGTEVAYAPVVVCEANCVLGLPGKVRKVRDIIRCICILEHPVPNTNDARSCQIIIPQKQVGRKSDIYITLLSSVHQVCQSPYYVALISTNAETTKPQEEIQSALQLLGPIKEQMLFVKEELEPLLDGKADRLFVFRSDDATSHLESAVEDVLDVYTRITQDTLSFE